jgi:cytochrome P450
MTVHLSPEIYGKDAKSFRPARWIEANPEQLEQMRQSFLGFSIGIRYCIGQK